MWMSEGFGIDDIAKSIGESIRDYENGENVNIHYNEAVT